MSSLKVTVNVWRRGVVVDFATERPVRRLPDGVSGVVYGGDVYPLRRRDGGSAIDLGDAGIPKERCASFVALTESLVFLDAHAAQSVVRTLVPDKWSIESNRFGHYVVFDGAETFADEVVARLEADDFVVKRWGASTRSAADGYFYDWFVRLDYDGGHEECRDDVYRALSVPPGALAEGTSLGLDEIAEKIAQQEQAMSALLARAESWATELAAARDEAESLGGELAGAHAALAAERASASSMRAELERLRSGRVPASEGELAARAAAEQEAAQWQGLAES
ncbi:MAG TPA: hypothetical protein VIH37_08640, partial [Candidatus Limnocylindrales bacterium]